MLLLNGIEYLHYNRDDIATFVNMVFKYDLTGIELLQQRPISDSEY